MTIGSLLDILLGRASLRRTIFSASGHSLKRVLVDRLPNGDRAYECACGAQYLGRSAHERGHGPIEDCPVYRRENEILAALGLGEI